MARTTVAALLVLCGCVSWIGADTTSPTSEAVTDPSAYVPLSSNPDDLPVRARSGKVFASTDPDRPPAYGPDDASVLVLVFSDFQCPVCRRAAEATHQIAEEFPGEVRVEFWQRTSPSHRNAENAAVASLAAHRQGRFWDYHDELFRNQRALDPTSLVRYAEEIGLDVEAFELDYADPALRARVRAENADAEAFGARGTPAFMINGITSVGWGSWNTFRATVGREAEAARQLEAEGRRSEAIAAERAGARIDDPERLARYRERVLVTRGEATGD